LASSPRPEAVADLPGLGLSLLVTVLFGLISFLAAVRFSEKSGG
jgi:hypothetical protein